jgi:hypothetical protein
MAPQRFEKTESRPGNGMASEASNPQDVVQGRACSPADEAQVLQSCFGARESVGKPSRPETRKWRQRLKIGSARGNGGLGSLQPTRRDTRPARLIVGYSGGRAARKIKLPRDRSAQDFENAPCRTEIGAWGPPFENSGNASRSLSAGRHGRQEQDAPQTHEHSHDPWFQPPYIGRLRSDRPRPPATSPRDGTEIFLPATH